MNPWFSLVLDARLSNDDLGSWPGKAKAYSAIYYGSEICYHRSRILLSVVVYNIKHN